MENVEHKSLKHSIYSDSLSGALHESNSANEIFKLGERFHL